MQTQTSNTLHNAIMEAGGKVRSPMLAPANYVQWKSRIKKYINTKPNHELIHCCLKNPPYKFTWADKVVPVSEGIDNEIYSTVDACPNACEMWKAIERLKQGESINFQDLETNLYWEFRKFTSRDGESLESYYSRFYKMMNELVRNQCEVTNHQVNVQFLLQLQPEWQRFVTLIKHSQELKTVSYHKLYDILKQHQNKFNELRAEKIACTANPLALVAQQPPVYHPQNHPTHYTQNSSTRSRQAATRNRGKAIVNSPPSIYDQEPFMIAEDDEMSKDKEIDKLMALISLSFKKIYKPSNNSLRTSSNTSKANQDNSSRINRGAGYDNQILGNVVGARETVGTTVVQKSRIQCYNCKEFGHVVRECQKLKRAKDAVYHREKMLLYKQEEARIQLNAEQADWKDDTDDELKDQELEAHYIEQLDQDDNDDLANEREFLASLIEKLKCEIDDSKDRNKFLETSNKVLVDKLKVVSKSFAVTTVDAPNQRQQQNTTPLTNQTTPEPTCQVPTQASTVTSTENINQAEMIEENAQVENDEFVNIFCTPVQDKGETSSQQVIGNPSQSVRTRRQLESDGQICMFVLTESRTESKNIKESMADSAWIESMQEELHQFDRLDVWENFSKELFNVKLSTIIFGIFP
nr:hypothetical protein [Tanacetum cinerariifolium]